MFVSFVHFRGNYGLNPYTATSQLFRNEMAKLSKEQLFSALRPRSAGGTLLAKPFA